MQRFAGLLKLLLGEGLRELANLLEYLRPQSRVAQVIRNDILMQLLVRYVEERFSHLCNRFDIRPVTFVELMVELREVSNVLRVRLQDVR